MPRIECGLFSCFLWRLNYDIGVVFWCDLHSTLLVAFGRTLPAGGYLVLFDCLESFDCRYGDSGVLLWYVSVHFADFDLCWDGSERRCEMLGLRTHINRIKNAL